MTLRTQDIPTAHAARWVGIHRPTLYYRGVDRSARCPRADELLVRHRLRAIALRHGTYGIRRVTALARHAGLTINRKWVRRILGHRKGCSDPPISPDRGSHRPDGSRPSTRTNGSTPTSPTSTRRIEVPVR